jgi:hypothetical protein
MTLGIVRGLSCLANFSGDHVDPVVTFGEAMDHGLDCLGQPSDVKLSPVTDEYYLRCNRIKEPPLASGCGFSCLLEVHWLCSYVRLFPTQGILGPPERDSGFVIITVAF